MSAKFKAGTPVRQIVKPIEGVVKNFAFDPAEGVISYVVAFSDENGDHEVSFKADELESNPDAETEAAPDADAPATVE